jgi:hypothetical protein
MSNVGLPRHTMRAAISALHCCALICANAHAQSLPAPVQFHSELRIDAPPGHYRKYATDFTDTNAREVEISFREFNQSSDWASSAQVCVVESQYNRAACIVTSVSRGSGVAHLYRRSLPMSPDRPDVLLTKFNLTPAEPFTLLAFAEAGVVHFALNDRPLHSFDFKDAPTTFTVSCSSAKCLFRIR